MEQLIGGWGMDFQKLIDNFTSISCILSYSKDTREIRIVCGNQAYIDSLKEDHPTGSRMLLHEMIADIGYESYFPKVASFEDDVYKCAVQKQSIHTFVNSEYFNARFNIFMLPLDSDRDDVEYCMYTMSLSAERGTGLKTNLSVETAADVLNTCIKLHGTEDFVSTVNDIMADIRRICDARHVCLLQVDYANRSCYMLAQAYADSAKRVSMNHWQDEEHFKLVESWSDILDGNPCLVVRNEDDMIQIKEKNPDWYESLHKALVDSIVLLPMKTGGDLLGYIWATNFDVRNAVRIKETLELTTYFLASEFSAYQNLNRLHRMSTIDELTGVLNRNAMNIRLNEISSDTENSDRPIGLVFTDLNGLKRVNDNEGHQAGDLLLKNASVALQNAFIGEEIYRAGGDEFLVLLPDTTREGMERKISRLKTISSLYGNVSFSVGSSYLDNRKNIHAALDEADKAMYADKELFYKKDV